MGDSVDNPTCREDEEILSKLGNNEYLPCPCYSSSASQLCLQDGRRATRRPLLARVRRVLWIRRIQCLPDAPEPKTRAVPDSFRFPEVGIGDMIFTAKWTVREGWRGGTKEKCSYLISDDGRILDRHQMSW